jgi:hypothetical protein
MNVPNRDDVADLGLRLSAIEERLARIETLIERSTGVSAATADRRRPPRTRKPKAPTPTGTSPKEKQP